MTARGLLAAVALCLALPSWAQAQATDVQIKAAFLYKFGAYVEWPPGAFVSADAPYTIGLIGADDVADELERITEGRAVHGRAVAVRRLKRGEALGGVHVLFVGKAQTARLAEVLAAAKAQPLLVVTEAEAMPQGSMINFVPVENKLRFDIALVDAERAQLRISARLLAVARKVLPG